MVVPWVPRLVARKVVLSAARLAVQWAAPMVVPSVPQLVARKVVLLAVRKAVQLVALTAVLLAAPKVAQ